MRIGIFGTGIVGQTIGRKLVTLGHAVKLGSRTADNVKAAEWAAAAGPLASHGTFADAAAFGELLFNCTAGNASLAALQSAGAERMRGKVLVDVANPLDFSRGFPPSLTVCNTDSLAETLQRAFPDVRVVKALNTVNAHVMVAPSRVPAAHDLFMAGDDAEAKALVRRLLEEGFGWRCVHDLGDLTGARATEMLLPLWVRLYSTFKSADFGFHVAKA